MKNKLLVSAIVLGALATPTFAKDVSTWADFQEAVNDSSVNDINVTRSIYFGTDELSPIGRELTITGVSLSDDRTLYGGNAVLSPEYTNNNNRFNITGSGNLTLKNILLADFKVTTEAKGGAIYNKGSITISAETEDMSFSENSANATGTGSALGGAIYNEGEIIISTQSGRNITFSGNTVSATGSGSAKGGAIYNAGGTIRFINNGTINFVGSESDANTDSVYNDGTLLLNGTYDMLGTGTINLKKVDGTGRTDIYGGNVFANGDFNQKELSVNGANFTANKALTSTEKTYIENGSNIVLNGDSNLGELLINNNAKLTSNANLNSKHITVQSGGSILLNNASTYIEDYLAFTGSGKSILNTNLTVDGVIDDYKYGIEITNSNVEINGNITTKGISVGNSKLTVNGDLNCNGNDENMVLIGDKATVTFNGSIASLSGETSVPLNVIGNSTLNLGAAAVESTRLAPINNFTLDNSTLNMQNGSIGTLNINNLSLLNQNNLMLDADLANGLIDTLQIANLDITPEYPGTLKIADIKLLSDSNDDEITMPLFIDETTKGLLKDKVSGNLTGLKYSPIYKYNATYDPTEGEITFTRFAVPQGGNEADIYNPAILPSPVAAQISGVATMMENFNQGFKTVDNMMNMPRLIRKAYIDRNKYALADETPVYTAGASKSAWVSPYTSFENVKLDNGPDVDAITYGSYFGGDSEVYSLRHGWDAIYSVYAGYNGAYQTFEGVNMNYNGGSIGASANFFKGNFFTAINLAVGAGVSNANTMYGPEYSTLLNAGAAVKAGYNFEFKNGLHILQPSLMIGYSLVNTFDYTNAAGVDITSDPLHAIVIQPQLKYILNLKNGWQPYAAVGAVFNIMDKSKFYAQDIALPEMSMRPYIQYGIGVQKQWGDRCTGYAQAMVRNIGRNGVALSLGFKWQLGKGAPARL